LFATKILIAFRIYRHGCSRMKWWSAAIMPIISWEG
jgi:hypothetical protein